MKSWYDLTKEEKQNLTAEYNEKNNDKDKILLLNTFKAIFSFISVALLFYVMRAVVSKMNEQCYEHYCENDIMLFGTLFLLSLSITIMLSKFVLRRKKNFNLWLKSKNIEK